RLFVEQWAAANVDQARIGLHESNAIGAGDRLGGVSGWRGKNDIIGLSKNLVGLAGAEHGIGSISSLLRVLARGDNAHAKRFGAPGNSVSDAAYPNQPDSGARDFAHAREFVPHALLSPFMLELEADCVGDFASKRKNKSDHLLGDDRAVDV